MRAPPSFLARTDDAFPDQFLAGIRSSIKKDPHLRIVDEDVSRLVPDGILRIPLLVDDRGRRVPVFVYAKADRDAAGHWHGAQRLLAHLGLPAPVHYAAAPLAKVPADNPCGPFAPQCLRPWKGPDVDGCAAWWPTPGEKRFLGSTVHKAMRRYYEALDGRERHLYRLLMERFGLDHGPATDLPSEAASTVLTIEGPDGRPLELVASKRTGVRFRFPQDTPPAWRDTFVDLFADFAEELGRALAAAGIGKDGFFEDRPMRWFEKMEERAASEARHGAREHAKDD